MALRSYHRVSTADLNQVSVHPAPCILHGIHGMNSSSTNHRFIKIYDKASTPILGYDVPVITFVCHKYAAGVGTDYINIPKGLPLQKGLAIAITGVGTDEDATAIAAADVVMQLYYEVP